MEKIPITDPKAGKATPVPVKGVDLPATGDAAHAESGGAREGTEGEDSGATEQAKLRGQAP